MSSAVITFVQSAEELTLRGPGPTAAKAAASSVQSAHSAVEALFHTHYARIAGVVARLTGDRAQAEEIASDVFHKLSQRPELLSSRESVTPWIYRVATNAGLDALRSNMRRRKREESAAGDASRVATDDALDGLLREERQLRVQGILGKLKPRDAELLLLRAEGMAYRELAEAIGVAATSIGTLLVRAEAEFEKRYRARYGEQL